MIDSSMSLLHHNVHLHKVFFEALPYRNCASRMARLANTSVKIYEALFYFYILWLDTGSFKPDLDS